MASHFGDRDSLMRDRKGLIFGIGGATAAVYGARSMQHLRTLGVMSHLAVSRAGEMPRSHVRWKRISGTPPAFADQSHPRFSARRRLDE